MDNLSEELIFINHNVLGFKCALFIDIPPRVQMCSDISLSICSVRLELFQHM